MGLTKAELQVKVKELREEVADLKEQLGDSQLKRIVEKVEKNYEEKLAEAKKEVSSSVARQHDLKLENKKLKTDNQALKLNLDKRKEDLIKKERSVKNNYRKVKTETLMWRKEAERLAENYNVAKDEGFEVYSIDAGEHYSKPRLNKVFWTPLSLDYTVVFESENWYDPKHQATGEENDFNKLFGINFGLLPHKNSIRVGWRPVADTQNHFELTPYIYKNGEREEFQSFRIEAGMPVSIKFRKTIQGWEIKLSTPHKNWEIDIDINKSGFAYLHNPYVGGESPLSKTMNLKITYPKLYSKSTKWLRGKVGRFSIVVYMLLAFLIPPAIIEWGNPEVGKIMAILAALPIILIPLFNALKLTKFYKWLNKKFRKNT